MAEEYEVSCCVRDYHVYHHIWAAAVGEELICEREPTNDIKGQVCSGSAEGWKYSWTPPQENLKSVFTVFAEGREHSVYSSGRKALLFRFGSRRAGDPMHASLHWQA